MTEVCFDEIRNDQESYGKDFQLFQPPSFQSKYLLSFTSRMTTSKLKDQTESDFYGTWKFDDQNTSNLLRNAVTTAPKDIMSPTFLANLQKYAIYNSCKTRVSEQKSYTKRKKNGHLWSLSTSSCMTISWSEVACRLGYRVERWLFYRQSEGDSQLVEDCLFSRRLWRKVLAKMSAAIALSIVTIFWMGVGIAGPVIAHFVLRRSPNKGWVCPPHG